MNLLVICLCLGLDAAPDAPSSLVPLHANDSSDVLRIESFRALAEVRSQASRAQNATAAHPSTLEHMNASTGAVSAPGDAIKMAAPLNATPVMPPDSDKAAVAEEKYATAEARRALQRAEGGTFEGAWRAMADAGGTDVQTAKYLFGGMLLLGFLLAACCYGAFLVLSSHGRQTDETGRAVRTLRRGSRKQKFMARVSEPLPTIDEDRALAPASEPRPRNGSQLQPISLEALAAERAATAELISELQERVAANARRRVSLTPDALAAERAGAASRIDTLEKQVAKLSRRRAIGPEDLQAERAASAGRIAELEALAAADYARLRDSPSITPEMLKLEQDEAAESLREMREQAAEYERRKNARASIAPGALAEERREAAERIMALELQAAERVEIEAEMETLKAEAAKQAAEQAQKAAEAATRELKLLAALERAQESARHEAAKVEAAEKRVATAERAALHAEQAQKAATEAEERAVQQLEAATAQRKAAAAASAKAKLRQATAAQKIAEMKAKQSSAVSAAEQRAVAAAQRAVEAEARAAEAEAKQTAIMEVEAAAQEAEAKSRGEAAAEAVEAAEKASLAAEIALERREAESAADKAAAAEAASELETKQREAQREQVLAAVAKAAFERTVAKGIARRAVERRAAVKLKFRQATEAAMAAIRDKFHRAELVSELYERSSLASRSDMHHSVGAEEAERISMGMDVMEHDLIEVTLPKRVVRAAARRVPPDEEEEGLRIDLGQEGVGEGKEEEMEEMLVRLPKHVATQAAPQDRASGLDSDRISMGTDVEGDDEMHEMDLTVVVLPKRFVRAELAARRAAQDAEGKVDGDALETQDDDDEMITVQIPAWFGKEDTHHARSSIGDDDYDIASLDRALTLNVSLERRLREKVEREKIKRLISPPDDDDQYDITAAERALTMNVQRKDELSQRFNRLSTQRHTTAASRSTSAGGSEIAKELHRAEQVLAVNVAQETTLRETIARQKIGSRMKAMRADSDEDDDPYEITAAERALTINLHHQQLLRKKIEEVKTDPVRESFLQHGYGSFRGSEKRHARHTANLQTTRRSSRQLHYSRATPKRLDTHEKKHGGLEEFSIDAVEHDLALVRSGKAQPRVSKSDLQKAISLRQGGILSRLGLAGQKIDRFAAEQEVIAGQRLSTLKEEMLESIVAEENAAELEAMRDAMLREVKVHVTEAMGADQDAAAKSMAAAERLQAATDSVEQLLGTAEALHDDSTDGAEAAAVQLKAAEEVRVRAAEAAAESDRVAREAAAKLAAAVVEQAFVEKEQTVAAQMAADAVAADHDVSAAMAHAQAVLSTMQECDRAVSMAATDAAEEREASEAYIRFSKWLGWSSEAAEPSRQAAEQEEAATRRVAEAMSARDAAIRRATLSATLEDGEEEAELEWLSLTETVDAVLRMSNAVQELQSRASMVADSKVVERYTGEFPAIHAASALARSGSKKALGGLAWLVCCGMCASKRPEGSGAAGADMQSGSLADRERLLAAREDAVAAREKAVEAWATKVAAERKRAIDEAQRARSKMRKQSTWSASMAESLRSSVHGIFADFEMPEAEELDLARAQRRSAASRPKAESTGDGV